MSKGLEDLSGVPAPSLAGVGARDSAATAPDRRAPAASLALFLTIASAAPIAAAAEYPAPKEGNFVIRNFHFRDGESLPELRIHYATLGALERDSGGRVTNAVLIQHGTAGSWRQFTSPVFADVLFGHGQLLDASRYYIIMSDSIGHGGSSKPSDSLRAHFPHYDYDDMVAAQHQLVTEGLGVNHLRLVMGTSMGCMHSWVWGETYPDFMDALMPLACLPVAIAGRNRVWREEVMDSIRLDPAWRNGKLHHGTFAWVAIRSLPAAHRHQRSARMAEGVSDARPGRPVPARLCRKAYAAIRRQRHALRG